MLLSNFASEDLPINTVMGKMVRTYQTKKVSTHQSHMHGSPLYLVLIYVKTI